MSAFAGFNRRYQDELTEEIKATETPILNGTIVDFAEYKRLVGKRSGLLQALERHKELLTLMEAASDTI